MNIYINLEVAVRELDSKLLLAAKAAARGHHVLIGEESAIEQVRKRHNLAPGIYHTKSLTPSEKKKQLHSQLKTAGFLITSIDEEGGLVDANYDRFAKLRYSEEMLDYTDAVFCWGAQDYNALKKSFPTHANLIHMTGSPRVDLWRPEGKEYSLDPTDIPERPYLLVSSNFGLLNNYRHFWELVQFERKAGYFDRDPDYEKNRYYRAAETITLMYEFIKAIEHLAEQFPELDIVVRPHPVERSESWQAMIDPRYNNIKITRSGSITPWVHKALAVMHNGCTTAMEATISSIPVLTFKPIKQKYQREIPNAVGKSVTTKFELADALRTLFVKRSSNIYRPSPEEIALVAERVWIKDGVFAADSIIECWESLFANTPANKNDWNKIARMQNIRHLKETLRNSFRSKGGGKSNTKLGHKFPAMQPRDVIQKIEQIRIAGSIAGDIRVKMLSGNMFVVGRDL